MKCYLLKNSLWIFLFFLSGCAVPGGLQETEISASTPTVIELECTSANRLGCRHKGNVYPWNAWVEVQGYDSHTYFVKGVNQHGNHATVMVVKR